MRETFGSTRSVVVGSRAPASRPSFLTRASATLNYIEIPMYRQSNRPPANAAIRSLQKCPCSRGSTADGGHLGGISGNYPVGNVMRGAREPRGWENLHSHRRERTGSTPKAARAGIQVASSITTVNK